MSEPINVTKYTGRVMLPSSMLEDTGLLDAMISGISRDMRGERIHGPRRYWEWQPVPDDYLDTLSHDELLAEAKRLHGKAVAWVLNMETVDPEWDADDPDFVNLVTAEWTVAEHKRRP